VSAPQPQEFPQLAPTGRFICDRCGVPISSVRTAWGQWYTASTTDPARSSRNWGFSIVHGHVYAPECTLVADDGPTVGDYQLDFLLSADGLAYLLEFFVDRDVDPEELSVFIMRLFVPGYEQVHRDISIAMSKGIIAPRRHSRFITQKEVHSIFRDYLAKLPTREYSTLEQLMRPFRDNHGR
jgi:hypothetical protein